MPDKQDNFKARFINGKQENIDVDNLNFYRGLHNRYAGYVK